MFFDLPKYGIQPAVITDNGEQLSYNDLYRDSQAIASHIPAGSFVFTLCENWISSSPICGFIVANL